VIFGLCHLPGDCRQDLGHAGCQTRRRIRRSEQSAYRDLPKMWIHKILGFTQFRWNGGSYCGIGTET